MTVTFKKSLILPILAAISPAFSYNTYQVQVGRNGTLRYDPQFINAEVGSKIVFTFNRKNHTVTQSSFDAPCTPLLGGSDSDFMPVGEDVAEANLPTWEVTVDRPEPLYFHCKQPVGNHCGAGMVFAINPPAEGHDGSLSQFQAAAIATNGTVHSTTRDPNWSTPAPQTFHSATATITKDTSVWTTTYTSYDGQLPPSPAATPVDHKIIVGPNGTLTYSPANIKAQVGDRVIFEFRQKNHTVTQSSFSQPCVTLQDSTGKPGFDSGFNFFVPPNATEFPSYTITINDTAPIWGYCRQTNPTSHCGAGMVFAINAIDSSTNNFPNFVELAKRTGTTGAAAAQPSTTGHNGASSVMPTHLTVLFGIISLGIMAF